MELIDSPWIFSSHGCWRFDALIKVLLKGWSPHVREFKTVLDPGFHVVVSRFQVLDSSLCQWNLDSRLHSVVRIQRAILPIPKPRIPDSTSKNFPDSGIQIPLHLGVTINFQGRIQEFLIGGWRGVGSKLWFRKDSLSFFVANYRIYSINHPGRLLNVWTLRVGAYSRWALINFFCL